MSTPHSLLIADRRPAAARGLAAALADTDDLLVGGICHGPEHLATALERGGPIDVVVIDAEMFDSDALRAVQSVRALNPTVGVLMLTTGVDEPLLAALAHERVGCVSAYSDERGIADAIRALLAGKTLLPPQVQRALTEMLRRPSTPPSPKLTSREEQVLELAATGLTISQIATSLHISHSTAKTHLLRVYAKLEAPNRSAAVAIALAHGMLGSAAAAA